MTDNANIKLDGNRMKDFTKTWDGMPMKNFRKLFYLPFLMAIGNIIMDGVACRDTINGVDHGGPNGPAANAAQNNQRNGRIRRIFAVLMCHIDSNSAVYSLLQSEYDNEGLVALQYVQEDHVGNLPLSSSEVAKLNNEWLQLDFHKVELNRFTILKYAEKIQLLAEDFPTAKTNQEKYDKFLDGLPSQLQNRVLDERTAPNAAFDYPANYPAAANHPQAGNAHPNAGEKNLLKVATHFSTVWMHMCDHGGVRLPVAKDDYDANFVARGKGKGKGKGAPGRSGRGNGRGGVVPTIRKPVRPMNNKVCCYKCGGLGHVARIKCEDGSWLYCATQEQIEDTILNGITYPHIPSAAERRNAANAVEEEAKEQSEKAEEEAEEDPDQMEAQFAAANLAEVEDDPYADE